MSKNTRSRGWSITLWKEKDNWEAGIKLLETADYWVYGEEICPSTGKIHLQSYGYWENKLSFKEIERWIPGHHWESSRGNSVQNRNYCIKDNNFKEGGILPRQGQRTDIVIFRDAILEGMSEEDLIMEYPTQMAKFPRFYQQCRNILLLREAKKMIQPEVIVLTGESGTGKTRFIYDNEDIEQVYKAEIGDGSSNSVFWDGYNGHEIILIDDFHCNLKLDYMLRLLDRYPMKLNIKGNHTWKTARRIYITSNLPLNSWYRNCPDNCVNALRRRISGNYRLEPNGELTDLFKNQLC